MKTFWKIVLGSLLGCLIAMLISMFIFFGMIGSAASASMKGSSAPKTGSVLRIDKSTIISERAVEDFSANALMSRSTGTRISLLDAVRAIDAAAADPAIKFIYLNTDELELSTSNAEELRAALARFRASGKAIVAYAENHTMLSYYLASVADKVIMNANGEAMMMGVGSQGIFIKDLLDKLGVEVQLIRHGKYKSAGEMFIKNEMSPENREQMKAMVDGL
ncbi:MAG: S49 family peptidase, partial [Bacteroidales bacterium]|nr:S49 family peptidase [Bacteroidales bacterium]